MAKANNKNATAWKTSDPNQAGISGRRITAGKTVPVLRGFVGLDISERLKEKSSYDAHGF
ncbi:MAG: hypothetical protein ACYC6Y_09515 [Thermoguttaceae bacterium]